MKKFLSICIVPVLALFVTSSALSGAPKKHLGIATYSVKGLESDIEGSFKALADDKTLPHQIPIPETFVGAFQYALQLALGLPIGFESCSSGVVFSFEFSDALFEVGDQTGFSNRFLQENGRWIAGSVVTLDDGRVVLFGGHGG